MESKHDPSNVVPLDPKRHVSKDIECLRCGTYNLPDNKICGKCGASLPIVYDESGKVFNWAEAQGYEEVMKIKSKGPVARPGRARGIMRVLIVLFAILFALLVLKAKHP